MPLLEKDAEETLKRMANITFSLLPSVDPVIGYNGTSNDTGFPDISNSTSEEYDLIWMIVSICVFLVNLFGMMANGTVIWILCCCMKRNPFTTYILNLSVADFGVHATALSQIICEFLIVYDLLSYFSYELYVSHMLLYIVFYFTFSTSQFLLAVISVDRCVCLFFPLWHKCHRPTYLSGGVSAGVWIFTFVISALFLALELFSEHYYIWYYPFLLNAVLSLPAISISTIGVIIKVYLMPPHHKQGKLLTAILLALLFFLLFAFPMNVMIFLTLYESFPSVYLNMYIYIGALLNSAINPVLYFLVGRDNKGQSRGRIKKVFEKLFQEEKYCKEEVESSIETYL